MRNVMVVFFTWFYLFLVFTSSVFAEPKLNIPQPPQTITEGVPFELQFQFQWPKSEGDYSFTLPDISSNNLELKRQGQSQETYTEGGEVWLRKTFVLEFTPLKAGPASIAPFAFVYLEPQTQSTGSLSVPELKLQIKKLRTNLEFYAFAFVSFAGIVLGIVIFTLNRIKKTKNSSKSTSLSPVDIYVTELQSLESQLAHSNPEILFAKLPPFTKNFISEFYKLPASRMTEEEIIQNLSAFNLPTEEYSKLQKVLKKFYEIKYLGLKPSQIDLELLIRDIKSCIDFKRVLIPQTYR